MSSPRRPSADATALEWMELHLRALYRHDEALRILEPRQPGGGVAPLFHLGRTRLGNLWRFRADLPAAAVRALARLAGREPSAAPGPAAPPERQRAIESVLGADERRLTLWRGPAFRFPERIEARLPALPIVEVTPDRAELLHEGFSDMIAELDSRRPCMAAVAAGRAASICFSSRPLDVAGSPASPVAEAGVETRPAYRGRGLAVDVVAAWALAGRAPGGEPAYSTSWDNRGSRAVARKLGLLLYGEDLHWSG